MAPWPTRARVDEAIASENLEQLRQWCKYLPTEMTAEQADLMRLITRAIARLTWSDAEVTA
ncbi:MAG TPA: hypothetical protein VFG76_07960 [Candidatus Polarisedimenticolia bacterium]|nr:hypothetical protein [Candidatus Polarisedimenticolia bacterium]